MSTEETYDTRIVVDGRITGSNVLIRLTPEGKQVVQAETMRQLLLGMIMALCDYHREILKQNHP